MPKIIVVGNQPSAIALRQCLADLDSTEPVTLYWGARQHNGDGFSLNGVPSANALSQFEAFETAGLSIPVYTDNIETAKEWSRYGIKSFGRRLYHTRGNDIVGAGYHPAAYIRAAPPRPESFNHLWLDRDFWVQVVPATNIINEWRIHVFQGRVIARGLKVRTGPQIRIQPVRNRLNGWTLTHDVDPPQHIKEAARKAVAAVGYNFGAVDIFDTVNNGHCVLEVNSAPALLSDYTMAAYVKALGKIAEGKYRKIYQGPTVEE